MLRSSFLFIVFVIFYAHAYTQEYTKSSFFKFIRPGIGLFYNTEDGIKANSILHANVTGSIKKGRNEFIVGFLVSPKFQKTESSDVHYYTTPGTMLGYTYDLNKEADKNLFYLTGGLKFVIQEKKIIHHSMGGTQQEIHYFKDQNWICNTGIGMSVPCGTHKRNRFFVQISYSVDYCIQNSISNTYTKIYKDHSSRMYWKRLDLGTGFIFGRLNSY